MITFVFKLRRSRSLGYFHREMDRSAACYNRLISIHRRYYRLYGKHLGRFQLERYMTKMGRMRRHLDWSGLYRKARSRLIKRIDDSYTAFFEGLAGSRPRRGIPKYKKRAANGSFAGYGDSFSPDERGIKINGNTVTVGFMADYWKCRKCRRKNPNTMSVCGGSNCGGAEKLRAVFDYRKFRFFKSRDIEGDIQEVIFKRDPLGDVYMHIVTRATRSEASDRTHKAVGFDMGLKTFLTGSQMSIDDGMIIDGPDFECPEFYLKDIERVKRGGRKLSRKKKGSNNYRKSQDDLARVHRRIKRRRYYFHWKLANKITDDYDEIYFEDLSLLGMQRLWGRKITDMGFASFVSKVEYLAAVKGKRVVRVGRFFPSSKMCFDCKEKHDGLELHQREWKCKNPKCASGGTPHDRDRNASKNILYEGREILKSKRPRSKAKKTA